MCFERHISLAKIWPLKYRLAFETEWNRIANLLQYIAASSSTYHEIMKDLFTRQEVKRDCLQDWFAESHKKVVDNLSSTDHVTYHHTKERIQNFLSNYCSSSKVSSKNSKPPHKANTVTAINGTRDKMKKKPSSSFSNSGSKEYY
jgi:hypothetical protein